MIKYFCDKCGKETDGVHICKECELQELTCGFKVGDKVITSTGEVGHIDWICDCDNCKERGFFEPHVETEIGLYDIYITDGAKRNGFRRFYSIGNYIFGNIDEDGLGDNIKSKNAQIHELKEELVELNAQLDVIKQIKGDSK
jgi:hypothetical protein